MLEVLKFIINCIVQLCAMLFTIDIGFTSLGTFMCIVFIFLPLFLVFVNFLKGSVLEELDDRYDESRPVETWHSSERRSIKLGQGHTFTTYHNRTRRRRYKL